MVVRTSREISERQNTFLISRIYERISRVWQPNGISMRIEAETNLFVAKANFYFVLGASCVARFTNSSRENFAWILSSSFSLLKNLKYWKRVSFYEHFNSSNDCSQCYGWQNVRWQWFWLWYWSSQTRFEIFQLPQPDSTPSKPSWKHAVYRKLIPNQQESVQQCGVLPEYVGSRDTSWLCRGRPFWKV